PTLRVSRARPSAPPRSAHLLFPSPPPPHCPTSPPFRSLATPSVRQPTFSGHSQPPVTDNRLQTKKPLKIVNFQWQIIYLTALNFFSPDECHKYGECRDTAYNRKQSGHAMYSTPSPTKGEPNAPPINAN